MSHHRAASDPHPRRSELTARGIAAVAGFLIALPIAAQVPVGSQFLVNSYTTDFQFNPSVAMAPNGDFVVVWRSNAADNGDSSSSSIQGQRFAFDGSTLGGQFLVNSYTTSYQGLPAVAVEPSGSFVVVWESFGFYFADTTSLSVHGQRFASDGSTLGAQFMINSYYPGDQRQAAVAALPGGGFVVVWADRNQLISGGSATPPTAASSSPSST